MTTDLRCEAGRGARWRSRLPAHPEDAGRAAASASWPLSGNHLYAVDELQHADIDETSFSTKKIEKLPDRDSYGPLQPSLERTG